MRFAYKYRLYPTKPQSQFLDGQLREACSLYNAAKQERDEAWKVCRKSINYYDQANQLKAMRAEGLVGLANYSCCQDVLRRVDKTYQAFFARVKRGDRPGSRATAPGGATTVSLSRPTATAAVCSPTASCAFRERDTSRSNCTAPSRARSRLLRSSATSTTGTCASLWSGKPNRCLNAPMQSASTWASTASRRFPTEAKWITPGTSEKDTLACGAASGDWPAANAEATGAARLACW